MKRLLSLVTSAMLLLGALSACPVAASDDATTETDVVRVMPLGDSITDGYSTVGGYRVPLCNLLETAGLSSQVDFVGPNWGGNCYDPQNAGYSGYSIDNIESSICGARTGLYSFIDWLMESYPADVVLLQIGTNDILSLYELDTIGERLELLVDSVLSYLPEDGMLYLATIPCMDATNTLYISEAYFTVESMDAYVAAYNESIRALVAEKQLAGESIALADINSVLTKTDLYDGVHPTEAGYAKMGEYWYNILTAYLDDKAGTTDPIIVIDDPISGDLNEDNSLSVADLILLQRYLLRVDTLTLAQAALADMDENTVLNAMDYALLKQAILAQTPMPL